MTFLRLVFRDRLHQLIEVAFVIGVADYPEFVVFAFREGLGNFVCDLALVLENVALVELEKCV